jgi:PAS domain S-box-containing protein
MALLNAFAPQAGVAIENARLFGLERLRRRQAQAMKELTEEAAAAHSYKQALAAVVKKMGQVSEVDRVLLFSYQEDKNEIEFEWGNGLSVNMTRRLRETGRKPEELDEVTIQTIRNRQILAVEDTEADPRVNRANARFLGIRSGLMVPVMSKDKVLGLFILGDSKNKRVFSGEDMEMIKAIADQAGIAIEQARLRQRIRDRERRLQELEASEMVFIERERSETIISANPDAIFLVDRDRTISLFNPAARELFGLKEEEALGRHAHEVLYGESGLEPGACGREGCPIDSAFRGESIGRWEIEYERPDGSRVWLGGSFSVIRNKKRQIENVICVFRDISEQKRLQYLALVDKELDIAAHIQSALLPEGSLENHVVRILAHQEQARLVGGDWYDFWEEKDQLVLVVGDAAGSGIPAALLATLCMSAIRAEAAYRSELSDVLLRANRAIVPHRMEDRFLTVFYSQLDLKTLKLSYVNAGHNDPILVRGGSLITLASKKRSVLGAFEDPELEIEEFQLQPGDRLFLYTDGVIECRDSRRRAFGENRLRRYLKNAGSREPVVFMDDLVDVLKRFCGKGLEDDFTFLICDIK